MGRKLLLSEGLDPEVVRKRIDQGALSVKGLHEFMVLFGDVPEMSYGLFNKEIKKIEYDERIPSNFIRRGRRKGLLQNNATYPRLVELIQKYPNLKNVEYADFFDEPSHDKPYLANDLRAKLAE